MITDYSAACGLLGGLRRNSFKEDDLSKLEGESPDFIKNLLKSCLGDDYPPKDEIDFLERALYVSCIKKTTKLLRFLAPGAREVLKALILEFDILNLKLLIRRIKLGTDSGAEMFYWGFPYLAFKDIDPSVFKDIDSLEQYLKKSPFIRGIFTKALGDLKFHKDIFYFDIRLDREYFSLLKNMSLGLDRDSSLLIQNFISVRSLIYALRLKFFQGKDSNEIRSVLNIASISNNDILSHLLSASSLEDALSVIEKGLPFLKFREKLSLDFEEDLTGVFYEQFLKRRGVNFFSMRPYLTFYLSQRYLIERIIFIMNNRLN